VYFMYYFQLCTRGFSSDGSGCVLCVLYVLFSALYWLRMCTMCNICTIFSSVQGVSLLLAQDLYYMYYFQLCTRGFSPAGSGCVLCVLYVLFLALYKGFSPAGSGCVLCVLYNLFLALYMGFLSCWLRICVLCVLYFSTVRGVYPLLARHVYYVYYYMC
jgi:hypothetical protein